jgi:hypothetical protein
MRQDEGVSVGSLRNMEKTANVGGDGFVDKLAGRNRGHEITPSAF